MILIVIGIILFLLATMAGDFLPAGKGVNVPLALAGCGFMLAGIFVVFG